MDVGGPFHGAHKCFLVTAGNNTPGTAVQRALAADPPGSAMCSMLVWNADATKDAFLAFADTAAQAQSNCVIPTAGTPQPVIPLPHGVIQTFTLPLDAYYCAICADSTPLIYMKPGDPGTI